MGRRRGRDDEESRPVEPEEARAHGNEPDAVQIDRERDERERSGSRRAEDAQADRGRREEFDRGDERDRGDVRGRSEGRDREEGRDRGEERDDRQQQGSQGADRGTSWASVIIGWIAAVGAGTILSGIVGAIVGAVLGGGGSSTTGGISGLVGVAITLLLGFLIGGYAAGRMASRSGVKHGLLVAVLALVIAVLLALVGAAVGGSLLSTLGGGTLSQLSGAASGVPQPQGLGTILTVSGIVALLCMFGGAIIGGIWGARVGHNRP